MANNSGVRTVIFNSLERLLSTDLVRLQTFQSAMLMQALKAILTPRYAYESTNGLDDVPMVSGQTPAQGVVLGGMMLTIGTSSITVDSGVVCMPNTTGQGPDDCDFIAGVLASTSPAMAYTAHSTGGTLRWDVLEVSITPSTTTESNLKAIYNPSTRTFGVSSVPKVRIGSVQLRIRTGTANADPTFAAGWLPIAMIHHPDATTSFAQCNIFDVRPLFEDMCASQIDGWKGVTGGENLSARTHTSQINVTTDWTGTPLCIANISADAISHQGPASQTFVPRYRVQGQHYAITAGIGGAETSAPNLYEGAPIVGAPGYYYALGYTHTRNRYVYVSLVFPWGLPRWVPYSRAAIGTRRIPVGCGGILSLSAGTQRTLPSAWSVVGASHSRVTIGAVWSRSSVDGYSSQIATPDGWVDMDTYDIAGAPSLNGARYAAGVGNTYTIARGTHVPDVYLPVVAAKVAVVMTTPGTVEARYANMTDASQFIYADQAHSVGAAPTVLRVPLSPSVVSMTMQAGNPVTLMVATGYQLAYAGKL